MVAAAAVVHTLSTVVDHTPTLARTVVGRRHTNNTMAMRALNKVLVALYNTIRIQEAHEGPIKETAVVLAAH